MRLDELDSATSQEQADLGYDIVDDIVVFMRNDPNFYRKYYYPKMTELARSYKKTQQIDYESCNEMIDAAIPAYFKKYEIVQSPKDVFTKDDRSAIISLIFDDEAEQITNGGY
jgi:tagatose-1,6-bisphosphate aldolase non-catalytic subunit AgaZ/GatZ